ncbi:hypothetical protein MNV_1410004 [Candidatus Methanoperedens nitroreducens]|uniref:Uncharacterized protein n=1 Tax=Candidatus Methanoperedens nitratireducens TaxID=1392998 RepID=A0A284VKZ3_9EURY|nr:hypothetical protein MNV_1410004 [Candidatus Methanoperedens nitroreducens]
MSGSYSRHSFSMPCLMPQDAHIKPSMATITRRTTRTTAIFWKRLNDAAKNATYIIANINPPNKTAMDTATLGASPGGTSRLSFWSIISYTSHDIISRPP